LLLVGSSLAAFTALQHIPVAEFTAIVALSPLVVTVLAALIFRERVSLLRWLLVLGGFAGALIIIRPGAESFSAMMLLPLLVLAANSSFQLLTSHMVRTEDPMTMHLYTGWIGALISALALPWAWAQLSGIEWARMMVMGLSAAIGHFLLILAYSRTPVAVMAPYLYAQIAFAVIGGWLVFSPHARRLGADGHVRHWHLRRHGRMADPASKPKRPRRPSSWHRTRAKQRRYGPAL
jgi:drug/metabolite transporter (DMT)-like permease